MSNNTRVLTADGLQEPVEVLRDHWGVPHIYARNAHDLFFAQGFMAGMDRLWQIDCWRRRGVGAFAEAIGPSATDQDRVALSLAFTGDWTAEWSSYAPDAKDIVTAFTDGINCYIESLAGNWPKEFKLASYEPSAWRPEDCLTRVPGLTVGYNALQELERALLVGRFGPQRVADTLSPGSSHDLSLPDGMSLEDLSPAILSTFSELKRVPAIPVHDGSNAWVISGALTASGKPLLANDPHREFQVPSLRRVVHLVAPGWNVIGAGEPALPGVTIGHNEKVAFGLTTIRMDQQDLYVERLNPAKPNEYLYRGSWHPVISTRRQLRVRGYATPVEVELRYTRHGPVLFDDRGCERAYAIQWVGAEPGTAPYLAGLSVARAEDWDSFAVALERWKVPGDNFVYADTQGNIGWHAAGLIPIRKNWTGLLPVPGHDGAFEWEGFRSSSQLPSVLNPSNNRIVRTNYDTHSLTDGSRLSHESGPPFRQERINALLDMSSRFCVEDFERIQHDVVSIPAQRFVAMLRSWVAPPDLAADVVDGLRNWDAVMSADSWQATVVEMWIGMLAIEEWGEDLAPYISVERVLAFLERNRSDERLTRTLRDALRKLHEGIGSATADWAWGRLHYVDFKHPLPGVTPSFVRVPKAGNGHTVNLTAPESSVQHDLRATIGATYRQVIDLADWDRSTITNAPGESGNPASKHYGDQLRSWAAGIYHPLPYSRSAVEAACDTRLLLLPGSRRTQSRT